MSSSSRKTYDTDSIALRRIFAYDISNNTPFSTGYVLTSLTKGVVSFVSPNVSLSTIGLSNLPATISTLTSELLSTAQQVGNTYTSSAVIFLPSTVAGLGSSGYLSTASLGPYFVSTTRGLGSAGYVSTALLAQALTSTSIGLGTLGYLSSGFVAEALTSTTIGLGTLGYLSSAVFDAPLGSTIQGLGTYGYISTSQLTSTVAGLGSLQYISSSQLLSSIASLSQQGFLSTSQLTSTVAGLGTSRYVSTSQLTSSIVGLGSAGYLSTVQTFRSTYRNTLIGNFSNLSFLYSNISTNTASLSTIYFDLGDPLRSKIIPSTTRLDIELKQNAQFAYYDSASGAYQFNSFLVRGPNYAASNVIGQESLNYYILNFSPINLAFFFQEKTRFLITDPTTLSTLKSDTTYSTLSLHHTFGSVIPTTNQFFASPAFSTCATVVLDNSAS
jgi:hypothetical protein